MRFQSKLFTVWLALTLVLWTGLLWAIHRSVEGSFDRLSRQRFAQTKLGLLRMEQERVRDMREACRLMLNIPQLRSLIAEQNQELVAENLESLQERLDYLSGLIRADFFCVLNGRQELIAQNRNSPWETLARLDDYLQRSRPGKALLAETFQSDDAERPSVSPGVSGLWAYDGKLYEVVAMPLIFQASASGPDPPDGALVMGSCLTDALAAELGSSYECQVTLFSTNAIAASSLDVASVESLRSACQQTTWPTSEVFSMQLKKETYRSLLERLVDPCSGEVVGTILIQRGTGEEQAFIREVGISLAFIMASGLLAAALLSFLFSRTITRPVQIMARGVRQVAQGNLDVEFKVTNRDELGELARAFNDMLGQIRRLHEEDQRQILREAQLAAHREQLLQELQRASQAKSDFLANMSHELRTPLNAIIGFSELLLEPVFGELKENQRSYVVDILDSGRHLLSLINDILDLSKIEAGKTELELEQVDLAQLLRSSLRLVAERATKHQIELSAEIADDVQWIEADPRKLKQIVFNLLSNAVKFTPDGGKAGIRAWTKDGSVLISVWDTGIGIAASEQEKIFQAFYQVGNPLVKSQQGTGLGLSLVRQLAEKHGGKVWVRSEEGMGSEFFVELPQQAAPSQKAEECQLMSV